MAQAAASAASDKLATDIVAIDVSENFPLADVFLACSASNERQRSAIIDNIHDELAKLDYKPLHREGGSADEWVLLDYPDIVVHVLDVDARKFYRLESLWNDCPLIELPVMAGDQR